MLDTDIWQGGLLAEEGEVALLGGEEEEPGTAPYWVSISRKSGFRRLHRLNGCGVNPLNVHSSEDVWNLSPDVADKKCLICFRDDRDVAKETEVESTSGSSSSSSSEMDEEEET